MRRTAFLMLIAVCLQCPAAAGRQSSSASGPRSSSRQSVRKPGVDFRWKRDDMVYGYVVCNGKKVDAIYKVVNGKFVTLGVHSYVQAAVDTTIAGRVEESIWK